MAKQNKVCFYPFKPLKRIDRIRKVFPGRQGRVGRNFASYFHYSRETVSDHEKNIIGATCESETIPSFSSYAQEMSIFVHVSRWNSIELSRINVEARQDMLNFRRSLVSCRQSTSLLCRLERLVMEPKFVTVTRSDRKRS